MTDRATTYDELKDAISGAYPTLSPQLQRLARYALDKPHDLALGTVAAVAEANAVQPSSTIRFANALGFDGFSQMQQVFRSHLVERGAPYRERIKRMQPRRARPSGGVLHQFVGEAVDELRQLEEHVDPKALAAAARAARRARRRSTCWRSGAPSRSPATSPTRSTSSSCARTCSTAWAACCDEFARGIGKGEVLLVASFRNYTPAVVETALACRSPRRLGRRHHRQRAVAAEAGRRRLLRARRRLVAAVPLAGRAALPGAGARRQHRAAARRARRGGRRRRRAAAPASRSGSE